MKRGGGPQTSYMGVAFNDPRATPSYVKFWIRLYRPSITVHVSTNSVGGNLVLCGLVRCIVVPYGVVLCWAVSAMRSLIVIRSSYDFDENEDIIMNTGND